MDLAGLRIGIIGGSLAGLACAAVLERAGAEVAVVERSTVDFADRGGGLGVDLELVKAVTGDPGEAPPHLVHRSRRVWVRGSE